MHKEKEYDEAVKEIDLGFYFLDRAEVSKGKEDKRHETTKAIEMQKQLREANSKSYRLALRYVKKRWTLVMKSL